MNYKGTQITWEADQNSNLPYTPGTHVDFMKVGQNKDFFFFFFTSHTQAGFMKVG